MNCRPGCGACCIAPSISSPIPGMPLIDGISKPAGVRCVQLDEQQRCRIFGQPGRPAVCASLMPTPDMCGDSREQALRWLGMLERETSPAPRTPSAQTPGAAATDAAHTADQGANSPRVTP